MREETNGTSKQEHRRLGWANPLDEERRHQIQQRARVLDRQARAFIREHPAGVVLAAVAIGFLVGRLVRS